MNDTTKKDSKNFNKIMIEHHILIMLVVLPSTLILFVPVGGFRTVLYVCNEFRYIQKIQMCVLPEGHRGHFVLPGGTNG